MAGFAVALNGHVYEGEYQASEALTNGMFAYITGGKVAKLAGTKDTYLRIVRKFQQWGLYWLEAIVTDSQDDETSGILPIPPLSTKRLLRVRLMIMCVCAGWLSVTMWRSP
jgi:hypothetical protein